VDLGGNPLHMLGKFDLLLKFLQILRRRFGLHVSSSEETRMATLPAAAPLSRLRLAFP
jgi:hypothetical protein